MCCQLVIGVPLYLSEKIPDVILGCHCPVDGGFVDLPTIWQ